MRWSTALRMRKRLFTCSCKRLLAHAARRSGRTNAAAMAAARGRLRGVRGREARAMAGARELVARGDYKLLDRSAAPHRRKPTSIWAAAVLNAAVNPRGDSAVLQFGRR